MPYALELEQAQIQAQDQAIEALFLDGVHDGFNGDKPKCSEVIYLQGYCQGMRNFQVQLQHTAVLLEQEAMAVEGMAFGVPF